MEVPESFIHRAEILAVYNRQEQIYVPTLMPLAKAHLEAHPLSGIRYAQPLTEGRLRGFKNHPKGMMDADDLVEGIRGFTGDENWKNGCSLPSGEFYRQSLDVRSGIEWIYDERKVAAEIGLGTYLDREVQIDLTDPSRRKLPEHSYDQWMESVWRVCAAMTLWGREYIDIRVNKHNNRTNIRTDLASYVNKALETPEFTQFHLVR